MLCQNCGTETTVGQRFCEHCGAEVGGPYAVSPASLDMRTPRGKKWVVAAAVCVTAGVAGALWVEVERSNCKYEESSPSYSPNNQFYTQMQMTLCRDHAQSHLRLVMGKAGEQGAVALLDFGAEIGTVHLSWQEGPELHVQASASAITHRYGPYICLRW
jgi:hypothetical protein